VGHRIALDAVERGICTSCYYNSDCLAVHVVASGCVDNKVLGRKANGRERKLWHNGAEYIMRNCIIGNFT
jgi:predicted NAD-dependent protein-ADP-ribosyltransferase YbiA (DUF1768 family)